VVPVARLGEVTRWVSSWPEFAGETGTPESRLVVLTGLDTKGLEFDGIVVVQPQEIEDEAPTGRATLYVVYTRATQRMVTLTT
jgi:DNA helicase IV